MYALIDQPVERLGQGSRFMLWAMRGWAEAIGRRNCAPAALAAGFAGVGLLPALPDVHMALALLNRDGLEKLRFAPAAGATIAEDEAVLLALWQAIAAGAHDHARATLALIVEEDAIAPVAHAMAGAAGKLRAMGFAPVGLAAAPDARA